MNRSDYPSARPFLPDDRSLENMAMAADGCQGCPLFKGATQAVFGEGNPKADLMLVGDQPGPAEDQSGRPFVGAAGDLLDRALNSAGLRREDLYLTNAVKHFKSNPGNGETAGVSPSLQEAHACNPWLQAELEEVKPRLVIAMGALAARILSGEPLAIGEARQQWLETTGGLELLVTYHPVAVLRIPAEFDQNRIFDALVADLTRAREALFGGDAHPGATP